MIGVIKGWLDARTDPGGIRRTWHNDDVIIILQLRDRERWYGKYETALDRIRQSKNAPRSNRFIHSAYQSKKIAIGLAHTLREVLGEQRSSRIFLDTLVLKHAERAVSDR